MSACFEVEKGIFVSLAEAEELYKILTNTDESQKSNGIKVLEEYLSNLYKR